MAVIAQHFLDSAIAILAGYSCEMDARNAASRAYYCAYHLAAEALPYLPKIETDRAGMHEKLILAFDSVAPPNAASRDCKVVAQLLKQLRKMRVDADYALAATFRRDDAEVALAMFPTIAEKIAEAKAELAL
jgi:uncharacterized protein (UPF0332 family)